MLAFFLITSVGGVCAILGLYYFFFDRIFQRLQRKPPPEPSTYSILSKTAMGKIPRHELERFIHEEYDSPGHDVVVVVMSNKEKCTGIVTFLQERKMEYFLEEFPVCCKNDLGENQDKALTKAAFAGLHLWAKKFTMADSVAFVVNSKKFVQLAEDPQDDYAVQEKVQRYEENFDFKLAVHWTENFVCDTLPLAYEDLWYGVIDASRKLLQLSNEDQDDSFVWNKFPIDEWDRKRINLDSVHFHQWPHSGKICDDEVQTEELVSFVENSLN